MTRREVIAYAITHAPPGVKGGPYTGNGSTAHQVPSMALARRYALDDLHEAQADVAWLVRNEYTARVIRIVRARVAPMPKVVACNELADGEMYFIDSKHLAAPSEASAIAVLREWMGWMDVGVAPRGTLDAILARARSVLAASGPDPMPVVRAAMEWRYGRRGDTGPMNTLAEAVETYRKDGGE